jgi:membrane protein implicated in regulation of membrane protease activity
MAARRFWTWLAELRWWAVLALIAGICCVVLAFTGSGKVQVIGVAALSITLAILATKEEP